MKQSTLSFGSAANSKKRALAEISGGVDTPAESKPSKKLKAEIPTESPEEEKKENKQKFADLLSSFSDKPTARDFPAYFAQVANQLMNEHKIVVNSKDKLEFRIAEVEFYLSDDKALHKDTFTHGDAIQGTCGKWYFHRLNPTNWQSFKAGTYKGMDLSFGNKKNGVHGGILIRALINLKTGDYIEGPCNAVTTLLKQFGCTEFKDMKLKTWPDHDGDAFDVASATWFLKETSDLEKKQLQTSPRVGLTLKRYDEQKEKYWMEDYRFMSHPDKVKKQSVLLQVALLGKGKAAGDVAGLLKMKPNQIKNLGELKAKIEEGRKLAKGEKKVKLRNHEASSMNGPAYAKVYGIHQVNNGKLS